MPEARLQYGPGNPGGDQASDGRICVRKRVRLAALLLVTSLVAGATWLAAPAGAQVAGRDCEVVFQEYLATLDALDAIESLPPGPLRDEQIERIEDRLAVLGVELDTCEEGGIIPPEVVIPDLEDFESLDLIATLILILAGIHVDFTFIDLGQLENLCLNNPSLCQQG